MLVSLARRHWSAAHSVGTNKVPTVPGRIRWVVVCALAILAGLGVAADTVRAEDSQPSQYLLAAGDVIAVRIEGEADLSKNYTINNAGQIILPLLGPITVADTTTQQSQEALTVALSRNLLVQPIVSVSIETYRPISVMGAVRAPGIYPFAPGRTVKSAIAQAGGYGIPGQTVGALDWQAASERLGVLTLNHDRLLVRQARLEAQLAGKDEFKPPQATRSTEKSVNSLMEQEMVNLTSANRTLASQVADLEAQRPQLVAEEQALDGQITTETEQTKLLRSRLSAYEKLDSSGLSRSRDLTELRIALATKEGNVWALKAQRSRVAMAQNDLGNKIQDLRLQFKSRSLGELDEVRRQLLELSVTLPSAKSILETRSRRADSEPPVAGSVTITRYRGTTREVIETDEFAVLEPGDHVDAKMPTQAALQN